MSNSDRKRVDWRIKASVPNLIALLPRRIGNPLYYWIQRRFGQLGTVDLKPYVDTALGMERYLQEAGESFQNARVFELGTGHNVLLPFMMWVLGADRIVTVDLNPYLDDDRIQEGIDKIRGNAETIVERLSTVAPEDQVRQRLGALIDASDPLETARIQYRAPYDASETEYDADSFDVHVSNQVLEHVPPSSIRSIMEEARRLLTPEGSLVHFVGMHDHFATLDSSISRIHFLKYDEWTWNLIAGNRFMYHNRLRTSELLDLVREEDFVSVVENRTIDDRSLRQIEDGFPLADRFRGLEPEDLAVTQLHFVAKRRELAGSSV